jgi:type IV pilus assembly protein PilC
MLAWGWLLGLLLIAAVVAFVVAWRRPESRLRIDAAILRVPVIGSLLRAAAMAQFTWSCALLLKGGVTLLETLRVAAASTGNRAISGAIGQAAEKVLTGRDLASSLRHPVFPPLVAQLAAVGEKTGSLDAVMEEMSTYYQNLLSVYIKRMTAMVEPLLILLMGGMVGYVYFAFFQALLSATG